MLEKRKVFTFLKIYFFVLRKDEPVLISTIIKCTKLKNNRIELKIRESHKSIRGTINSRWYRTKRIKIR